MSLYNEYLQVKKKNSDALVFYRVGDFYELFGQDAVTASELLSLTLTSRDCGLAEHVPMCGVPYHSADNYIKKLIELGNKVAVCEPSAIAANREPEQEPAQEPKPSGRLNLTAAGTEQTIIKDYLEQNASEVLIEKINNGVKIVKDGKTLINKKTLETFMKYACDEAQKQADKGARSACIGQDTVFGWLIHYFEESSIEGTLCNEDGTEYKPPKPASKTNTAKTAVKPVPQPKPKPQPSLFDLIDMQSAPKVEADTTAADEPELDEPDEEACEDEQDGELDDGEDTDAGESCEDEPDDEPDIPKGFRQISDTQWTDDDGVVYETTEVTKPAVPDALVKLFGGAVIMR